MLTKLWVLNYKSGTVYRKMISPLMHYETQITECVPLFLRSAYYIRYHIHRTLRVVNLLRPQGSNCYNQLQQNK